ncbi:hypothetical protein RCL1_001447 [Eukaryota sp. TZLM3-RCL]
MSRTGTSFEHTDKALGEVEVRERLGTDPSSGDRIWPDSQQPKRNSSVSHSDDDVRPITASFSTAELELKPQIGSKYTSDDEDDTPAPSIPSQKNIKPPSHQSNSRPPLTMSNQPSKLMSADDGHSRRSVPSQVSSLHVPTNLSSASKPQAPPSMNYSLPQQSSSTTSKFHSSSSNSLSKQSTKEATSPSLVSSTIDSFAINVPSTPNFKPVAPSKPKVAPPAPSPVVKTPLMEKLSQVQQEREAEPPKRLGGRSPVPEIIPPSPKFGGPIRPNPMPITDEEKKSPCTNLSSSGRLNTPMSGSKLRESPRIRQPTRLGATPTQEAEHKQQQVKVPELNLKHPGSSSKTLYPEFNPPPSPRVTPSVRNYQKNQHEPQPCNNIIDTCKNDLERAERRVASSRVSAAVKSNSTLPSVTSLQSFQNIESQRVSSLKSVINDPFNHSSRSDFSMRETTRTPSFTSTSSINVDLNASLSKFNIKDESVLRPNTSRSGVTRATPHPSLFKSPSISQSSLETVKHDLLSSRSSIHSSDSSNSLNCSFTFRAGGQPFTARRPAFGFRSS